jgi:hypothetical protein
MSVEYSLDDVEIISRVTMVIFIDDYLRIKLSFHFDEKKEIYVIDYNEYLNSM